MTHIAVIEAALLQEVGVYVLSHCSVKHDSLRGMLFPGDGLESAAILVLPIRRARTTTADRQCNFGHRMVDVCIDSRKPDYISWPGEKN
jgi:hypothetical protein